MVRHGLAMSHLNIGNLLRGAERLRSYQRSVELSRSLVRDEPGAVDYRLQLITSLENVGDAQREVGNLAEARRSLGEALGLLEPVVREYPTNVQYRESLSRTLSSIGDVRYQAGELDEAIAMYRRSAELKRVLADDDPENASAARSAAYGYNNLGRAYMARGRSDDHEAAIAAFREAIRLHPDDVRAYHNLGFALATRGSTTRRSPPIGMRSASGPMTPRLMSPSDSTS